MELTLDLVFTKYQADLRCLANQNKPDNGQRHRVSHPVYRHRARAWPGKGVIINGVGETHHSPGECVNIPREEESSLPQREGI